MKLMLKRMLRQPNFTVGKLYIDGKFFCDTMEDVDRGLKQNMSLSDIRQIKVMHETAIPAGTYKVIVNMSPGKQRMLPRLLNVPGYEGILIHRGNTHHHSSGCILVGENKEFGRLAHSTKYEHMLTEILQKEKEVSIEIV